MTGIANYQTLTFDPPEMSEAKRCFVDGAEVHHVWFVDTNLGIVKSYDVLCDGRIYERGQLFDIEAALAAGTSEWEITLSGALSKTVRGKVELSQ